MSTWRETENLPRDGKMLDAKLAEIAALRRECQRLTARVRELEARRDG